MKKVVRACRTLIFSTISLVGIIVCNHCMGQMRSASGQPISVTQINGLISEGMDSLKIPGLSIAIIAKGKIVYQKEFGVSNLETHEKVNHHTIFEAASLSKPVFGYFLMKLVQDRIIRLDFDAPVYSYFPFPDIAYDERYKLITPRMLLTHTSGFPNWRNDDSLRILFTPGSQYSYSGEGYEYMANAVASLAHTNIVGLDSIFQKNVAVPLNMEHSGFLRNEYLTKHKAFGYYSDSSGENGKFKPVPLIFGAAYSLHTNAHDYAKFIIALMKGRGLKKQYVDTLLYPHVQKSSEEKEARKYYGYGFSIDSTKFGVRYQHSGNNGNFTCAFMFFRELQLGFVIFTNGDKCGYLTPKLVRLFTEGIGEDH